MASFKRRALNEHLLDLFIDQFEFEPTLIKSHANYQKLLEGVRQVFMEAIPGVSHGDFLTEQWAF